MLSVLLLVFVHDGYLETTEYLKLVSWELCSLKQIPTKCRILIFKPVWSILLILICTSWNYFLEVLLWFVPIFFTYRLNCFIVFQIAKEICLLYRLWSQNKLSELRARMQNLPQVNLADCVSHSDEVNRGVRPMANTTRLKIYLMLYSFWEPNEEICSLYFIAIFLGTNTRTRPSRLIPHKKWGYVITSISLSVCLFVNKITQKVMDRFWWNLAAWQIMTLEWSH